MIQGCGPDLKTETCQRFCRKKKNLLGMEHSFKNVKIAVAVNDVMTYQSLSWQDISRRTEVTYC